MSDYRIRICIEGQGTPHETAEVTVGVFPFADLAEAVRRAVTTKDVFAGASIVLPGESAPVTLPSFQDVIKQGEP